MGKMRGRAAKRRRTSPVVDKVMPQSCLPCENASVIRIESIPAHNMVALGCIDGSIRLYTLAIANASNKLFRVFKGHTSGSAIGVISVFDDLMLSVDSTGTIISWSALSGEVIESLRLADSRFLTVKKLSDELLLCSDRNTHEIRIISHMKGKMLRHLSTVRKVCGESPIINFAASQNFLIASSKESNDIHVWDYNTQEKRATYNQGSTVRGVLVSDKCIILGCDDGRIYIRKLKDMFQHASVIDLQHYIESTYIDMNLSMTTHFVSNDLLMAITRNNGVFLVSIKENRCVAHFQPDFSRGGSRKEMNSITATVLSDTSVCYGGEGYCYIFKPPRKVEQIIERSRRENDNRSDEGREEEAKCDVVDLDSDSEPASSSGRNGDDDAYANGGVITYTVIGVEDDEKSARIERDDNEGNTDGMNTSAEEGGTKNNITGEDRIETENEEEARDKKGGEVAYLLEGVCKMKTKIEEEKKERDRLNSIVEVEEGDEREKLEEILAGMEKAKVAAETRRKEEMVRQRQEINELRKMISEQQEKMKVGGEVGGEEGARLKEELAETREKIKLEMETQKTDFEFLRNVVNMLIQRK